MIEVVTMVTENARNVTGAGQKNVIENEDTGKKTEDTDPVCFERIKSSEIIEQYFFP